MSWSFSFRGAPEVVKADVKAYCDKTAENYAGWPEADDVTVVRDRVCALVDAMRFAEGEGVSVSANGSHSSARIGTPEAHLFAANASFSLRTITLEA